MYDDALANALALGIERLLHDERSIVRTMRKARAPAVTFYRECKPGMPARRREQRRFGNCYQRGHAPV